ncbi:MAG TPA: hypothetical protein VNE63_16135 [Candidatus Acidoferrales bacterium]|nr:hypothetical protein [Candidatus Acidoferrales bacterium]
MSKQTDVPRDLTNRKRRPCGPEIPRRLSPVDLGVIPSCEQANPLELLVQSSLESMGISLLMDWDMLVFLHHHGATLSSAGQMARLLRCESIRIGDTLDRLESRRLIESSRPSRGARFYKVIVSSDGSRQGCFQQLLNLTGSRAGRLMIVKILKPDISDAVPVAQSAYPY